MHHLAIRRHPALLAGATALTALAALTLLLAAPHAQAAGTVEVKFENPEKFSDIGFGSVERERNLGGLTEIFQQLGRELPDGQTLRVEVLDVDLAGEVRPVTARDYRILRGRADWPRMTLRYTLQSGDTTLRQGEQRLADMNYLFTRTGLNPVGTNLPYERRMVQAWFRDTIAKGSATQAQ